MDAPDLQAFQDAWLRAPDGWTGRRYADALIDTGRLDDAAAVRRAMWDLGYPAGLSDLAWLERDRGNHDLAIKILTEALPEFDDEDRPFVEGTIGHWRWCLNNDTRAEAHLRAGLHAYPDAPADLADLLHATDRQDDGRRVLEDAVAAGNLDSMLPLANLLDEDGDTDQAEQLYRRAYDLGDAHSAWNLAILLTNHNRHEEAEQWRWKAAQGGDELAIRHYTHDQEDQDEDEDEDDPS